MESRQDTLTSRSSQTGFSLGIGIGLGSVALNTPVAGEAPMVSAFGYGFTPNTNILSQTGTMLSNAGSFLASGGPFGNACQARSPISAGTARLRTPAASASLTPAVPRTRPGPTSRPPSTASMASRSRPPAIRM